MRNDYRHKPTGKIAEYDVIMSLWYVKGEEHRPIASWQLQNSSDWEEILAANELTEAEKSMQVMSYNDLKSITRQTGKTLWYTEEDLLKFLNKRIPG